MTIRRFKPGFRDCIRDTFRKIFGIPKPLRNPPGGNRGFRVTALLLVLFSLAAGVETSFAQESPIPTIEEIEGPLMGFPFEGGGQNGGIFSFVNEIKFSSLFAPLGPVVLDVHQKIGLPLAFILLVVGMGTKLAKVSDMKSLLAAFVVPLVFAAAVASSIKLANFTKQLAEQTAENVYATAKIKPTTPNVIADRMLQIGATLLNPTVQGERLVGREQARKIRARFIYLQSTEPSKYNSALRAYTNVRREMEGILLQWREAVKNGLEGETISQAFAQKTREFDAVIAQYDLLDGKTGNSVSPEYGAGDEVKRAVSGIFSAAIMAVAAILLFVSALMLVVAYVIMFFLIFLSAAFLPAFIAALSIDSVASIGKNYVLEHISLCSWPVGWALGHIGTGAFFLLFVRALVNSIPGSGTLGSSMSARSEIEGVAYGKAIGFMGNYLAQTEAHVLLASALPWLCLLFSFLIALWIAFVTLFMPLLINRILKTGGNFIASGGWMGATGAGSLAPVISVWVRGNSGGGGGGGSGGSGGGGSGRGNPGVAFGGSGGGAQSGGTTAPMPKPSFSGNSNKGDLPPEDNYANNYKPRPQNNGPAGDAGSADVPPPPKSVPTASASKA